MRHYYPEEPYYRRRGHHRRRALGHPVRSLVTMVFVAYAGWAFRGCVEKPETVAYRLNERVSQSPARYERLLDREVNELYNLKGRVHRRHPVLEGCVHPKDVKMVWGDERGRDYAVLQLQSGREYVLHQDGLGVRLEASRLEKTGDEK